ncbi:MAG: murein biosynthesis integral membrane protein MurJ [Gemmatimonadales bacterium]
MSGAGRHAARVAAGILVTRVLGYVRERVFAYYFGNGAAADAFRAALRIPNALRNLLGEGTLSASFIPVYAALNERADKTAARALAGAVLGLLLLASGVLAIIGIAFAPGITALVAQGFAGERRELTTVLIRILFPMSGLMVVSAWCLGVLNTHRRFFLPYAAPALWNIAGIAAMVGGAVWFAGEADGPVLTRLALALAWGTVVGSVLQVIVQLPTCRRLLRGIPLRASLAPEGVRGVLLAWTPLVIGAGVAQLSGLVDTLLASFTGEGGLASLGYAQLIQVLPISLFGASVAAVALPDLARDAAAPADASRDELRGRLAVGFRRIAFFVVPSAFAFAAAGPAIVGLLFQTGRFGADDTALVGGVLAAYGVGLLGHATVKLFASGFYALRDTRTPVRIAVLSLVVAAGLSWSLMGVLGPAGIALGSSLGGILNMVLQVTTLERRVGTILGPAEWRWLGVAAGGAVIGAALTMLTTGLVDAWGAGPVVGGVAVLAIFGMSYGATTLALRHPDAIRGWHTLTGSPAN